MSQLRDKRHAAYKPINVIRLIRNEWLKALSSMANGDVGLSDDAQCSFDEARPDIDISASNVHLAVKKAQACRLMRAASGNLGGEYIETALRHETALRTHEAMSFVIAGGAKQAPVLVDIMQRHTCDVSLVHERALSCAHILTHLGVTYKDMVRSGSARFEYK
jgi:hypothetical protein